MTPLPGGTTPRIPTSDPPATTTRPQTTLTLEQAIREALEKNLDLLARRFDLNIAEARIITAQARPNPVLSLGADHLDWLGTGYNEENMAGPSEYSVRTDFILEGGGKRQYRIEVAEAAREVTKLQLLDATREVILNVQNAFVDLVLAEGNEALAQENRAAFARIVRVSTERLRQGDVSRVELMRSRLAQLQYDNALTKAQARVRVAKQRLLQLIGRPIEEDVEVEGDLTRLPVTLTPVQLEDRALMHRPDLLALVREQARSQAEIRLQEALGKIDYTVGAEYRRQQGLAGRGNSVGLFFSIPLPIWDTNEGEIERAKQEYNQAVARTKALESTIRRELGAAWRNYVAAERTVHLIETEMLTQARQVLETMEYSYRNGQATLIELLDAQRAYNDTILSYNEARADLAGTRYLLESTIGHPLDR